MITFTVPGPPQGKARPRVFEDLRDGRKKAVTPNKTKKYEDLVAWAYRAAGGKNLGTSLVCVDIKVYYPIHKSMSKKDRKAALSGELLPTIKPDCDNVIKIILDALNGVAYNDDKTVLCVSLEKLYDITEDLDVTHGKVEVTVMTRSEYKVLKKHSK